MRQEYFLKLAAAFAVWISAAFGQTIQVEDVYNVAVDTDSDIAKAAIPNAFPTNGSNTILNTVQMMDNGDAITVPFSIGTQSTYSLNIRLRTGSSSPGNNYHSAYTFQVDGTPRTASPDGQAPDASGSYYMGNLTISSLSLSAGSHVLRIQVGWSHCYIDSLTIVNTAPAPTPTPLPPTPVPTPVGNPTSFNGPVRAIGDMHVYATGYAAALGNSVIRLLSTNTPSITISRANSVFNDSWWQGEMGTDNRMRLYYSGVPQLLMQNGQIAIGSYNGSQSMGGKVSIGGNVGGIAPNVEFNEFNVRTWLVGLAAAGTGKFSVTNGSLGTSALTIDGISNVGVGTNTPQARLHIQGTEGSTALQVTDNVRGSLRVDFPVATLVRMNVEADESLLLSSGGTNLMVLENINSGGNVGIGVNNPQHKLEVRGTVRAQEVIVETIGWSDYVFSKDYQLAPLSEVEKHIQQHGHLPGLPSASEVEQQGLAIGQMQALLLAKIEELTLHVIYQNKRITSQDLIIQAQTDLIAELKLEKR